MSDLLDQVSDLESQEAELKALFSRVDRIIAQIESLSQQIRNNSNFQQAPKLQEIITKATALSSRAEIIQHDIHRHTGNLKSAGQRGTTAATAEDKMRKARIAELQADLRSGTEKVEQELANLQQELAQPKAETTSSPEKPIAPTLPNILAQMRAGNLEAAQRVIDEYLLGPEGIELKESLASLMGAEKAQEFSARFLENYAATNQKLLSATPPEVLEFLTLMERHAKAFKAEQLEHEKLLELIAAIRANMDAALSQSPSYQSLSANFKKGQVLTLAAAWEELLKVDGITAIDAHTIQTANQDITLAKKADAFSANIQNPTYANLKKAVELLKGHCEQIRNPVLFVNSADLAAIKIVSVLLKEAGLVCALSDTTREYLANSTEPGAKEFLAEHDAYVEKEIKAMAARLNEKDEFPDMAVKGAQLAAARDKLDALRDGEEQFPSAKTDANLAEYDKIQKELKDDSISFNRHKAEAQKLLQEKAALSAKITQAVNSGNFTNEILELKSEENKLNIKLDNARHDMAQKWKAVVANVGYIDILKERFDKEHTLAETGPTNPTTAEAVPTAGKPICTAFTHSKAAQPSLAELANGTSSKLERQQSVDDTQELNYQSSTDNANRKPFRP